MLLDGLLPPGVVAVERRAHLDLPVADAGPNGLERATSKRRAEFEAGRACAAQALARLGVAQRTVGRAADRSPQWPPGTTGSITHCEGFVAAAVGRRAEVGTIGIDATPAIALPAAVDARLDADERANARAALVRGGVDPGLAATVLWGCREAAFKVWHPVTGRVLGIADMRVDLGPGETFLVDFAAGTTPPRRLRDGVPGRWQVCDGLVLSVAHAARWVPPRVRAR